MTRSTEARIATAERRAQVIALRRQGRTFDQIGAELGVSMQRAHVIYLDALKEIPAREVDQYRAEALELAHAAIENLLEIATSDRQPRTSVEAWNSIRAWSERIAKTVGSDASAKVDATITAGPDAPDILRLVEYAKAQAQAAKEQLEAQ